MSVMLTDDLVTRMKKLIRTEEASLWEQGDLLKDAALSDEEVGKLAEILQRKVATLRHRERVSREIPPEMRDSRHAWTIYSILIRIPDQKDRKRLLNARTEWRVEDMEYQVRLVLEKMGGGRDGLDQVKRRGGMRLGNVRIIGTLVGDRLKLVIEAPVGDVKVYEDTSDVTIAATINP
jgi:hypothetical protein